MKNIVTKDFGITNAENFEAMIDRPLSYVYVMMGRSVPWANTGNTELLDDTSISIPYDTTEYKNSVFKNGIVMKRITGADVQAVIPRVDWETGVVYTAYDQTANLFVKVLETQVANANVNVTVSLANTVVGNGVNFTTSTPIVSAGDFIRIGDEVKEVVRTNTAGDYLVVNSNFSQVYTSANIYELTYSTTQYSNKFYVRNSADQVFKCLYNANNAVSNTMPEIAIDGQLPENPFIETADGYKWKYMYTIPSGIKNKFFTNKYMPVLRDNLVYENSENGRIDIVQILDPGSYYFSGSTVNNYPVVVVSGDGAGANLTVDVLDGEIVEVNIRDGGRNYTYADITLNDPVQTPILGTDANLRAVISPQYGHGYDPARELGASYVMISTDFQDDMDGNAFVSSDGSDDFRQVAIIRNPLLQEVTVSNPLGKPATQSIYPMYTEIYMDESPIDFVKDQEVFVGESYAEAVFRGRIVHYDDDNFVLYVNGIKGNVDAIITETVYQRDNLSIRAKVFGVVKPDINILTGEILYIENRAEINRTPDQTETVKLVVEF